MTALADLSHLAQPTGDTSPADTWALYRRIIEATVDNQPRSLQTRIGPSELGTACDACLISKLAGIPEQPAPGTSWLPYIGTAVHEQLAHIFTAANTGLRRARWLVEMCVDVGRVGGVDITGHADLYDVETGEVTDWKIVGATTLRDVRAHGPSDTYRVQAHLYGRGFTRRGLPVQRVRIAYLPRNAVSLDSAYIWDEPYDEQIALDALARADMFAAAIAVHGVDTLLTTARHTGGHSCTRYGHTDPGAANASDTAFADILGTPNH